MLKKLWLTLVLLLVIVVTSWADTIPIRHFVVKENPFAQEQIAIVATDSLERIQENVNGLYTFSINGFESELNFQQGTAFYRHKIERSTFMFIRHQDTTGTHSILYYVFKHGDKLSPLHISWVLLLAIPLIIIFAGYLFKRFLIIAVIVLLVFLYFNHHNGLSIPNFFESIFDGLKSLFARA